MSDRWIDKVLVAEDDYLVAEEIVRTVRHLGATDIAVVSTGRAAVDAALAAPPEVVLMDIQMPDMDGIAAAREIQERRPAPVVILSAYDSPDLVVAASAAGIGAYVIKPPEPGVLARAITVARARHGDLMQLKAAVSALEQKTAELSAALAEIKTLRGILPMCAYCKRIRDDDGYWSRVDAYIQSHSTATVHHSLCAECAARHFPELARH
jgi:DNA-binding NarL/FixJ family response regulator